jgi:predicted RNA-binding Zn-ribbon protein involved in translation (DUF1610 family)
MAENLTVIYSARTVPDAHQLRNILLEAGIEAFVTSEALDGAVGSDILGGAASARVAVAENDAGLARQIALEFDRRIAAGLNAPREETPEVEAPPRRPDVWPRCPQCDALRITRCPVCQTAGTDFALADPEFLGTPAGEQEAEPGAYGCGSAGCSPSPTTSDTQSGIVDLDKASAEARSGEAADLSGQTQDEAPLMLMCPTCDDPFVPEYPRVCEWCGHEFPDGYETEPKPREHLPPRAIAVIFILLAIAIAFVLYFLRLL